MNTLMPEILVRDRLAELGRDVAASRRRREARPGTDSLPVGLPAPAARRGIAQLWAWGRRGRPHQAPTP